ncbi:MAG: SDR family oxidoreductase [Marivibrio sp.]|uniref:SDR family NAD(P)-dependent oxidoreductase n=1 Tax=Marivibrio sp. TaxID=2039719 RepID=UPI0032EDEBAC
MSARVLDGRTAIVTGGARGIGRAIVEAYRAAGAQVLTCGRGERPDDLPDDVAWRRADVSDPDQCAALVAGAEEAFGALRILVNNAGVQVEKTVEQSSDADWDAVMGANAKGVFQMARAAIPAMRRAGGGSIVNIGSISGDTADPQMALYNASKAFVHGLTRSIAVDHGADGIRCNAIKPGWIMTEMAEAGFALARDPEAAQRDALARHAAGRFGQPQDIAEAAVWLASDASAFVTGQTVTVDGGLTAASPLNPGLF